MTINGQAIVPRETIESVAYAHAADSAVVDGDLHLTITDIYDELAALSTAVSANESDILTNATEITALTTTVAANQVRSVHIANNLAPNPGAPTIASQNVH